MKTEKLIKLPAFSNSGHGSENSDPPESGCEAIKPDSLNSNSESKVEVNEEGGTLLSDNDVGMSISSDEDNLNLNSSLLKVDIETSDSIEAVLKITSVNHLQAENGSLYVQQEASFNNLKNDESLVCEKTKESSCGVKRPRISINEQQPSVRVIYSSLPRESIQKLEDLLQEWSKWHSQKFSSSYRSVAESGEETYYPALRIGLDNPSAISFWVDDQNKAPSTKEFKPFDGSLVPLYDRGYSLALTSGDASNSLDGALEKFDTLRCFNCGSYSHALRDCPKPHDTLAVNNARREHRSRRNQNSNSRNFSRTRYYQSSHGGKYDGLTPGVLDVETQRLLGLGEHDPPPWLNRMRELGYPPGYLGVDPEDQPSGITIFGEETEKETTEEGQIVETGPTNLSKKMTVEFPGINAPIPKNADEWLWASNPLTSNLPGYRPQRRPNHHPYESANRNERRWSRDFDENGPPGCSPRNSPSLSNHFGRYSEYGFSSPPARPMVQWSPSYGRSLSGRGRRNASVHDGSPSHGQYGHFPYGPDGSPSHGQYGHFPYGPDGSPSHGQYGHFPYASSR